MQQKRKGTLWQPEDDDEESRPDEQKLSEGSSSAGVWEYVQTSPWTCCLLVRTRRRRRPRNLWREEFAVTTFQSAKAALGIKMKALLPWPRIVEEVMVSLYEVKVTGEAAKKATAKCFRCRRQ